MVGFCTVCVLLIACSAVRTDSFQTDSIIGYPTLARLRVIQGCHNLGQTKWSTPLRSPRASANSPLQSIYSPLKRTCGFPLRLSGGRELEPTPGTSDSNPSDIQGDGKPKPSALLLFFSALLAAGTLAAMFRSLSSSTAGGMLFGSLSAGLASSSCCALQLMLNGLSALGLINVGCAGFNKTLGPLRTFFRAITTAWLVALWALGLRRGWPIPHLAATTAIAAALSLLPEALTALILRPRPPASSPPTVVPRELFLRVGGMGCEACRGRVKALIDAAPGVLSSEVSFAPGAAPGAGAGAARVRIDAAAGSAEAVIAGLAAKGYPSALVQ
jgi:copper chaperone CopZ